MKYPFPADPPFVPSDYNPVGIYVREFIVPVSFQEMDVFLDFEGVESAFYCWVMVNWLVMVKIAGYHLILM